MTDQPGRPPEERLPAPRPTSAPVPADRFSAPPSAHRNDLTPERAGRIVRQSANARWVGFLAVTIVALFVIGYYFYEVGLPGGTSEPRLDQAANELQVVAVERGYNLYQAYCARCHGANGEGGIGPGAQQPGEAVRPPQPAVPAHRPDGRRPLCVRQPEEPDAGLVGHREPARAAQLQADRVPRRVHPGRAGADVPGDGSEPVRARRRPGDRRGEDLRGLGRAQLPAAAGRDAVPRLLVQRAHGALGGSWRLGRPRRVWRRALGACGPAPGASQAPAGTVLDLAALNIQFDKTELSAPADAPFGIAFNNQDAGTPHNVAIKDANGQEVFKGEIFNGVATKTYDVPALKAGTYQFVCSVHPNMTGTLKVGG